MKNIIITVLIVFVLGLGGFIIYDKVINKPVRDSAKEEIVDDVEEEYNLEDAEALVSKYANSFLRTGKTKIDKEFKNQLALEIVSDAEMVKNISCDELYANKITVQKDDYGYKVKIIKQTDYDLVYYCSETTSGIDYDTANKYYHQLFGKNENIDKSYTYSIESLLSFDYNDAKNMYIRIFIPGSPGSNTHYHEVESAKKIGDKIEITIKDFDYFDNFYDNIIEYVEDKTISSSYTSDNKNDVLHALYQKVKDKLPIYKFTFVKEDNNYILSDVEKE